MQQIDAAYRATSDLRDRRDYKIYYSHIHPFPLLVLGYNPGGESDGTDLVASDTFFENWEHDYLCFKNHPRFPMASPMCALLARVLQTTSVNILRQVPATNVIFRRSRNAKSLRISSAKAALEAAPFLRRILIAVNPMAVLLVAKTAYDLFVRIHCAAGSLIEDSESRIFTPNGGTHACIFLSARARVQGLDRTLPLFMVGHLSKYSRRTEWSHVTELLGQGLQRSRVSPTRRAALSSS